MKSRLTLCILLTPDTPYTLRSSANNPFAPPPPSARNKYELAPIEKHDRPPYDRHPPSHHRSLPCPPPSRSPSPSATPPRNAAPVRDCEAPRFALTLRIHPSKDCSFLRIHVSKCSRLSKRKCRPLWSVSATAMQYNFVEAAVKGIFLNGDRIQRECAGKLYHAMRKKGGVCKKMFKGDLSEEQRKKFVEKIKRQICTKFGKASGWKKKLE